MRDPVVAGQFYADKKEKLQQQIEECYTSPLGPGEVPELSDGERHIVGAVVPHAGYVFSGPVASHVYSALARDGFPDTFVIIGPNHQSRGKKVALTTEDFKTPLGTMNIDQEMASRLEEWVPDDPMSHRYEHSIEVQLPFIQYISSTVEFVPVVMNMQDYETSKQVGKWIKRSAQDKDVVFIASSDLSHYVLKDVAKEKDGKVIDKILALDAQGVHDTVVSENISACGYGPIVAMMEACGATQGELLKYATSGDVREMNEVVGYAGIVLRR